MRYVVSRPKTPIFVRGRDWGRLTPRSASRFSPGNLHSNAPASDARVFRGITGNSDSSNKAFHPVLLADVYEEKPWHHAMICPQRHREGER
jgi:hypothetical protein